MPKKASERRKHGLEEIVLNLNPMMDMFAVLIPALLMMSVVVEVASVEVSAPAIGPGGPTDEKPPDEPPLDFTVAILDNGYMVSTSKGAMPTPSGEPSSITAPTFPVIEKSVTCGLYRATVPPPRAKNADRAPCDTSAQAPNRSFWVYDLASLHRVAVDLKNEHPNERRVIVGGVPTVDFEAISDVMNATRDTKADDGGSLTLFDEVVIRPDVF